MSWTRVEYDPVTGHAVADTLPPHGALIDRYVAVGGFSVSMSGQAVIHPCHDCGAPLASMRNVTRTERATPANPYATYVPHGDWWRPQLATG